MRVDVLFSPLQVSAADFDRRSGDGQDQIIAVAIDVLRATSVMVTACHLGVGEMIPVDSPDRAFEVKQTRPEVLLAGEVGGLPPEGFDFGNSPAELSKRQAEVSGKVLVMSTTNGTVLLNRLMAALRHRPAKTDEILVGAYLNQSALARHIAKARPKHVVLCCAGQKEQLSLEDAACAGSLVAELLTHAPAAELEDGAKVALSLHHAYSNPEKAFEASKHGKQLVRLGLGEDLAYCGQVSLLDAVPRFEAGQIRCPAIASG